MKRCLLLACLAAQQLYAQPPVVNIEALARQEMSVHLRGGPVAESLASDNYDVKYYRGDWNIDPNVRYISGSLTMHYKLTGPNTTIILDMAGSLAVDSVKQRSTHLVYSRIGNTLPVTLAPGSMPGVLDSITIFYKGVPANTGFGSFIRDIHAGVPVIWTLSEPYGARDWFPCKDAINDKADSVDVFITHPSIYRAASNGILQFETPVGGGFTRTHWKHRYPIVSYLICLAVTNYVTFNHSIQLGSTLLPMTTHCFPENQPLWQAQTPLVLEAMRLFHDTIGPYPFMREKYGHVQFNWGGGMEHQTSTFLSSVDESLMAHELAHQWFGDKITAASWQDIWLNEGFATHMAYYHFEKKYPASTINYRRNVVNNVTSLPSGSLKVADTTSLAQIFGSRLSYNKGSHVLYMLRLIMGDAVFFDAIRQYINDPALAYGNATTEDLKRHLEQRSGKDLDYFFDQWYTGQGYPSYHVQWKQVGSSSVNIKLSQVTSHPSVSFFRLPVPLTFRNATQSKTVIVDNTVNGQNFIRQLGFVPDTVLVDPEYWLLSRNNTQEKLQSTNTGQGVAEIYPNPVTDPLTIFLHDFSANAAAITIFNSNGQRMFLKNLTLTAGAELLQVPTATWSRGVYTIRINAGDKVITKQILR